MVQLELGFTEADKCLDIIRSYLESILVLDCRLSIFPLVKIFLSA